MVKIILNQNGEIEIKEIEVLSKEKNGKIIERDKNKKPIYERVPAIFWTTSEGNFDHRRLDTPRYIDDIFEIYTEGDVEEAKSKLISFAKQHFEGLINAYKGRIRSLEQQVEEHSMKVSRASKILKRLSET